MLSLKVLLYAHLELSFARLEHFDNGITDEIKYRREERKLV